MATEVLVPPLGQTVDSVTLVAWHKNEGEAVKQGEMLFAIETDKAVLDIEAPATGVLCRVTALPGDQVTALSAIALIAVPGKAVGIESAAKTRGDSVASTTGDPSETLPRKATHRILISPRARRLANEHDLSLKALKPTGPEGAIIERDVRAHLAAEVEPKSSPVSQDAGLDRHTLAGSGPNGQIVRPDIAGAVKRGPVAGGEVLEMIPVSAERMALSATAIARVTLNTESDATALVILRRRLARDGVDVSYNALLMNMLGQALREHPRLNASLVEDTIQVWRPVHIGLAVDTEQGLLVPVVRDVGRKGLTQLEGEYPVTCRASQGGVLRLRRALRGTFTLSNLGIFGIDSFTPIINPPECAILGVGGIKTQPVFAGNRVVARQMMWLSLSFDHRLVDGVPAARFMQRVVQLIEHPYLLFT